MTEDLKPQPGRIFIANFLGHTRLVAVKSVRKRKDGTASSCVLIGEGDAIMAEYRMRVGKSGELTGMRRVTVAQLGRAKQLAEEVGTSIPADSIVIVTKDRQPVGEILEEIR